jgi:perosamine synthetase
VTQYKIKLFEPVIEQEDIEAVIEVLKSGWLAHGPVVETFEQEFARYIGVEHAATVSNGTVALALALKALGVGPGDRVLVPDYTFIASATAAIMIGATPVFVDVDSKTFNISVDDVLQKVEEPGVKAIVAVHLFGHPAEIKALKEIATDKRLLLVEDAAQAHGAEAWGKKVGSFGDAAIFSFYATKNMTMGEGGIVVSNEKSVIEKVKMLRNHGQSARYLHVELGWNFRITSMQAALGRVQLRKLDRLNDLRRQNASYLSSLLSRLEGVEIPYEAPWAKHVYHVYAVKLGTRNIRDCVQKCMTSNGIEVAVHYPIPLHAQPVFRNMGYAECCPTSSALAEKELSLPVHPKLGREELKLVAETFAKCLERCREEVKQQIQ